MSNKKRRNKPAEGAPFSKGRTPFGIGPLAAILILAIAGFAAFAAAGLTDVLSSSFSLSSPGAGSKLKLELRTPPPSATPQLSKEYIYAGSRLVAVEDANASAAAPTDLAVWRPATGQWFVLGGPGSQQTTFSWGNGTTTLPDIPVPGDYDGDGKTDFSIFRRHNGEFKWYIVHSGSGQIDNFAFGAGGDKPAQADYDGDGKTDAAVYRPPIAPAIQGTWHIRGSVLGYYTYNWGETTDLPASADYDGDGKADISVYRGGTNTFHSIWSSSQAIDTIPFASNHAGDKPVGGDYDGDGRADYALFKSTTGFWHIRNSSNGATTSLQWGQGGDIEVPNDYDGDGRVDYAVWRPSNATWYIRHIRDSSIRERPWGATGDIPVPAFYRR